MQPVEQQELIRGIAERFAAVAPTGWARLVGNWEATLREGEVHLNYLTLAVVDAGGRWAVGQLDFDEGLYGLVVALNEGMAGTGERWTVLDLEVDADGRFRTGFGYETPKRSNGVHDHESIGRFQHYLQTWVAEKGPVPPA